MESIVLYSLVFTITAIVSLSAAKIRIILQLSSVLQLFLQFSSHFSFIFAYQCYPQPCFPLSLVTPKASRVFMGNDSNMDEHIKQIEKFLRGQMNQQEETAFKVALSSNNRFRSLARIMTFVLRAYQKSW